MSKNDLFLVMSYNRYPFHKKWLKRWEFHCDPSNWGIRTGSATLVRLRVQQRTSPTHRPIIWKWTFKVWCDHISIHNYLYLISNLVILVVLIWLSANLFPWKGLGYTQDQNLLRQNISPTFVVARIHLGRRPPCRGGFGGAFSMHKRKMLNWKPTELIGSKNRMGERGVLGKWMVWHKYECYGQAYGSCVYLAT